tara:strand:+ start:141 stop:242 length:102 start_codon:yes stop_codon:yes gene_type:complete
MVFFGQEWCFFIHTGNRKNLKKPGKSQKAVKNE